MNTNNIPSEDKEFESTFEKSKIELDLMRSECVARSLSDPLVLIHEKRMLINQLILILNYDIGVAWQQCIAYEQESTSEEGERKNAELKKALYAAMQSFYEVTLSLQHLDINFKKDEEEKFRALLAKLDEALKEFEEKRNKYNQDVANFVRLYAESKQNRKSIEQVMRGAELSTSIGLLSTILQILTIIGYSGFVSLQKAATLAGSIFYPIGAVFASITKLFNVIATNTQLGRIKSERQIALDDMERNDRLREAEGLLKTERSLKIMSFILNALSIIAFASALTNPIGWILVAVATIIDWRDAGVLGVKKANLEYENAKAAAFNAKGSPNYLELKNIEIERAEALNKAKTEELWYRVNAVAMVLFACAPIPIVGPLLLGMGFVVFGIASARNIYVALQPRFDNFSQAKVQKTEEAEAEEETEKVELENLHDDTKDLSPPAPTKGFTSTALTTKLLLAGSKPVVKGAAHSNDLVHAADLASLTSAEGIFPKGKKEVPAAAPAIKKNPKAPRSDIKS